MKNGKKERAKGALMGAFIGEALGVGPHWYYDLEALSLNITIFFSNH